MARCISIADSMIVDVMRLSRSMETSLGIHARVLLLYIVAGHATISSRLACVWEFLKGECREEKEEIETSVSSVPSVLRSSVTSVLPSAASQFPDALHLHPRDDRSIARTLLIRGLCVPSTEIRVGQIEGTLRGLVHRLRRE